MTAEIKDIHLPEKDGMPHGVMFIDGMPTTVNWTVHPWKGDESVVAMANRVKDFLAGNGKFFEIESPHDGLKHQLTRRAVERIQLICHGVTKGETEPHTDNPNIRLIRGGPGGVPILTKQ